MRRGASGGCCWCSRTGRMKAALGVLLPYLVLLLRSTALPRKGTPGAEAVLEQSLSEEMGLGAKRENVSRARPGLAVRPKMTVASRLLPEPAASCTQADGSSLQPWPLGGLEGPVCRLKMDRNEVPPSHLEVVGVLTRYESAFIKVLRAGWEHRSPETFGLCPGGDAKTVLRPLQQLQEHLAGPGMGLQRFLILHLEEVKWEAQPRLWFRLPFHAEVGRLLGELHVALLLFYPGSPTGRRAEGRQELLVEGTGLTQEQSLCFTRDTQYLLLRASVAAVSSSSKELSFQLSLTIRHHGDGGAPLSLMETQQLLFGSDEKCFTRMTPVLLLLAGSPPEGDAAAPSSYLSASGVVDVAPYPQLSPPHPGTAELPPHTTASPANTTSPTPGDSGQFLGVLTLFIRRVLSPRSEPPTQPSSQHWLDFQMMETLPHQLLNLSETAALERLVQSEEPSVLLFPQEGGAGLEQHFGDWQPEGTVLQLLMGKLQAVIHELRDIPEFQANTGLFQHLLSFCYHPPGPAAGGQPPGSGKLHALLLLKALQTVRARWQERRKVLRQNRSARHQAHCRLQELTIDLRDRNFIVMPTIYAANNCEGPCRLPLSTRVPGYHSHTVLLLGMQERGSPLQRAPCCVPVRYSDQLIISVSAEGLEVRKFPNMVAEECGCR
uniref:Muellerian-inhibiting factor n=3 Tax=Gallus gallus TaxID=9031 RepID=A0A8V1ADL9_CHICK